MIKKTFFFLFVFCFFLEIVYTSVSCSQRSEKFIILNLHWDNETIRLNTLHVAQGMVKNNRRLPGGEPFIYRVLSPRSEVLEEGYLTVPRLIHFDYVDSRNGQLRGGILPRREADFVVKIPAHENSQRILFYKSQAAGNKSIQPTTSTAEKKLGDMIGEIELQ
jgi:hypothetical protein